MRTTKPKISYVPFQQHAEAKDFPVVKKLSQTPHSVVVQLGRPYCGEVLKIFAEAKPDYSAAVTFNLLNKPPCANFPKLYEWTRLESADFLGVVSNSDKMFALRQQLGSPMTLLLQQINNPEQMRVLLLQLILPLVGMHKSGMLHADVKMQNYVNTVQEHDPEWQAQTRVRIDGRIYRVPHTCDGLTIKPLLIDYELALPIKQRRLSHFMVTSLHARPPELLFVSRTAPLLYTEQSETFGLATALLYELRFILNIDTPRAAQIAPEYTEEASCCIIQQRDGSSSEVFSLAYGHDSPRDIAQYAWLMVHTLGYPGDEEMLKTPLGQVVKAHKQSITMYPGYQLFESVPESLCHLMGEDGITLLRSALSWSPQDRPTLTELLSHSYFSQFLK